MVEILLFGTSPDFHQRRLTASATIRNTQITVRRPMLFKPHPCPYGQYQKNNYEDDAREVSLGNL